MTFQLDTSGAVHFAARYAKAHGLLTFYRWEDLSPFAQGYIEALFASSYDVLPGFMATVDQPEANSLRTRPVGFSDLAPETLARIIADCEAMVEAGGLPYHFAGTGFWSGRQAGNWTKAQPAEKYLKAVPAFPPLTVQLGDDGKVRFAA